MKSEAGGARRGDAVLPRRVQSGLQELAEVCERGRRSGWPSRDPWQNGEAWQNTYVALATRIVDGRVDLDRPLGPLARLAASRFLIGERRRQRRTTQLTDAQLHRFHLGDERAPEEAAEVGRRGDALRLALLAQLDTGKLSEMDLAILVRRYVDEWGAAEVAKAMGLTETNVRKICSRRRLQLREELVRLGVGSETAIA